jgi:hypothetical protein
MIGYIYKYTFPNGKIYIGQTRVSVRERHYQHMYDSKNPERRTTCERAIAKYGEPLCETIETIEVPDNEPLKFSRCLDEAERKWIKYFDCTTVSGKGYKIQEGGKILDPQEFVLQERWYEIFREDGWGESIGYVEEILKSIGEKICITKEKLTKEEQRIWYGYKFCEYELGSKGRETTFCSYYKRNIKNHFVTEENDSPFRTGKKHDKFCYDNIIKHAIEDNWIEDIRQTIWRQVYKEKKSLLSKYKKLL